MQERRQRRARFDALWAAHHDAVRRYALRREPALADDVVAETFAVAWRRLESVPAEPLPWLYGVARKTLANLRRREAHQVAVATRAGAEPVLAAAPLDGELLAALARLGPRDREALLLAAWEGLQAPSWRRPSAAQPRPRRCGCTGPAGAWPPSWTARRCGPDRAR